MALVVANRVKDTTLTTGTGPITLSGTPPTGYQSFGAGIGNGNSTYYTIAGVNTSEWEVGIGTYTASGTSLSRDTVLSSSNGGALVPFSAGTKDVFVTYPAEKTITNGYGLLPVGNGGTGTATQFTAGSVVFAGTSGVYTQDNANLFWDNTNNLLGIGNASPAYTLDVNGSVRFSDSTAAGPDITFTNLGGNTAINNSINGRFYVGAFETIFTNYDNSAEYARIDSSGNLLVTGAGALGYGTGSGGAVTQTGSRTTGVTLDKTNGAITLVSDAGTTTWTSFTVTNSTVSATDTIIINQQTGSDLYEIHITAVSAGSFRVSFRTTGGTTTEQPVFNFAVINAVTA